MPSQCPSGAERGGRVSGMIMRLYAHHYPDDVAGMVLVDSAHEAQTIRVPPLRQAAAQVAGQFRTLAWLSACGILALAPENIPARGLPDLVLSQYRAILATSGYFETALAETEGLEQSFAEVRAAGITMLGVNSPGHFVWEPSTIDSQLRHYAGLCAQDASCRARTPDLAATVHRVAHAMPSHWLGIPIDPGKVKDECRRFSMSPIKPNQYDVFGPPDAPPIVLVHGSTVTRAMWWPQIESLAIDFQVIALDLPGHGASAHLPFTFAGAVALLDQVVSQTTHRPVMVVGISLGGYVALEFAAAHPEKAAGLVLASTTVNFTGPLGAYVRLVGWLLARVFGAGWQRERLIRSIRRKNPPAIARVEREQVKWLTYGGVVAIPGLIAVGTWAATRPFNQVADELLISSIWVVLFLIVIAAHAVHLTADLQRSRERLVTAS